MYYLRGSWRLLNIKICFVLVVCRNLMNHAEDDYQGRCQRKTLKGKTKKKIRRKIQAASVRRKC